ncbi:MAG: cation diffusion facilitator family transporter, partial [Candidatus Eremiobacterota bacterium]
LEADSQHLMTDVWTSAAVLTGILLVRLTGAWILDPLVAMGMAVYIVWCGVSLVRRSASGLLDTTLPAETMAGIRHVLDSYASEGVQYHALRTRQAGPRGFVAVHILVPGEWTVQRGHEMLERVERDIRAVSSGLSVLTHLEPLEDPCSFEDQELDRTDREGSAPCRPSSK